MMLWAVIAEWAKGSVTDVPAGRTSSSQERASVDTVSTMSPDRYYMMGNETVDDPMPLLRRLVQEQSQRKTHMQQLQQRERYRQNLDRGLRLGHEISLDSENVDPSSSKNWSVSYKTDPLRQRELLVNTQPEELVRISWSSEYRGDTALVAYNYNTYLGHNASWVVSGSGGPLSITSKGEVSDREFEQENDLRIRSDIRSRPVETDLNGAFRLNYITENVDFRFKGAVRYPILHNAVKISHGIERQALLGCCWTLKAEVKSDELPWKAVRMETTGPVTGSSTRIDHLKAELIRNLAEAYDLEFEARTPFTRRGTKWESRVRHKNKKGMECVAFVDGEDLRFFGTNMTCNYTPVKNTGVSWSFGFQPENGWNMSAAFKLGEQNVSEINQNWNLKAEVRVAEGLSRRQADVDLYIPIRFPISF